MRARKKSTRSESFRFKVSWRQEGEREGAMEMKVSTGGGTRESESNRRGVRTDQKLENRTQLK